MRLALSSYKDEDEARAAGLKPGEAYGNGWVAWRKEDLDPNDTVTFVPLVNRAQRHVEIDGELYANVSVNGLNCSLHLNVVNTVNRMFYNAYQDAMNTTKAAEKFKKEGPPDAPWAQGGPFGDNTWFYKPFAPSMWFDQDGRDLKWDEHYEVSQEEGTRGMPISLGKTKDLIEAGKHPLYKRPPQEISYSIAFTVLITAIKETVRRVYRAVRVR